jgi:hypothetical protein
MFLLVLFLPAAGRVLADRVFAQTGAPLAAGRAAGETFDYVLSVLRVPFVTDGYGIGVGKVDGSWGELKLCKVLGAKVSIFNRDKRVYGVTRVKFLNKLGDLRGYVKISTPEQALSFVRLATAPNVHGLILRDDSMVREVEMCPKNILDQDIDFGFPPWVHHSVSIASVRRQADGYAGLTSNSLATRIGVHFANVKSDESGFVIERTLIAWDGPSDSDVYLVRTTEHVGPDGAYRIVRNERKNLDEVDPSGAISRLEPPEPSLRLY